MSKSRLANYGDRVYAQSFVSFISVLQNVWLTAEIKNRWSEDWIESKEEMF